MWKIKYRGRFTEELYTASAYTAQDVYDVINEIGSSQGLIFVSVEEIKQ